MDETLKTRQFPGLIPGGGKNGETGRDPNSVCACVYVCVCVYWCLYVGHEMPLFIVCSFQY